MTALERTLWLALVGEAVVFAVLLFCAAGTVQWSGGWWFLAFLFIPGAVVTVAIVRSNPDLARERMRPPIMAGQPLWDKVLLPVVGVVWIGWLVVAGLAVRFGWPALPVWLQWVGAVLMVVGIWVAYLAMRENKYSAAVVRIQAERGQHVIDTGPYAVVRHPMYVGGLIFLIGMGLILGSWPAFAGGVLTCAIIVLRTALEDRTLRHGLPGYADYAARVRYRLIPSVW